MRGPRTVLAVPGSSERFLLRAAASSADALMIDLEDGVPEGQKERARSLVVAHAPSLMRPGRSLWLRVNAVDSHDFDADASSLRSLGDILDAVVLPKAAADSVTQAVEILSTSIVALVESALGVEESAALTKVDRVVGVMFGALDYALDLAAVGGVGASAFDWAEARLVNSAAASGAWAVAGPTVALPDALLLRSDAERARALGYVGKLCIHPSQLAPVEDVFTPSADEVARAERILATLGDGEGAQAVAEEMVDAPVVRRARLVLAAARRSDPSVP